MYSGKITGGISDRAEALKCYKKASELKCPIAMNNLALMIENENNQEALRLFREAHKLGNIDATVNLAFYYNK